MSRFLEWSWTKFCWSRLSWWNWPFSVVWSIGNSFRKNNCLCPFCSLVNCQLIRLYLSIHTYFFLNARSISRWWWWCNSFADQLLLDRCDLSLSRMTPKISNQWGKYFRPGIFTVNTFQRFSTDSSSLLIHSYSIANIHWWNYMTMHVNRSLNSFWKFFASSYDSTLNAPNWNNGLIRLFVPSMDLFHRCSPSGCTFIIQKLNMLWIVINENVSFPSINCRHWSPKSRTESCNIADCIQWAFFSSRNSAIIMRWIFVISRLHWNIAPKIC